MVTKNPNEDSLLVINKPILDADKSYELLLKLLCTLFGVGTWIGVTGMYLELPLLVNVAPEGWKLASYVSIIVQLANIGPLIYMLMIRKWKNINKTNCIYIMQIISCLSIFAIAFLYKTVIKIGETYHSLMFLIFLFPIALVGCTSSVLYIPFMGQYKKVYLHSFLMGEGLGCFIASAAALFQGSGKCYGVQTPFNVTYYVLFIGILIVISFASFILMTVSKKFESGKIKIIDQTNSTENANQSIDNLSATQVSVLITLMGILCFLGNGFLVSIQSYSCLPYGSVAYHLAVTLSNMANPIACTFSIFWKYCSFKTILYLMFSYFLTSAYIITASVMSPAPPLVGSLIGIIIMVICWIVNVGLLSYLRLCIFTIFHIKQGQWLAYAGAASQLGSMLGAVLGFVLINNFTIFVSVDIC